MPAPIEEGPRSGLLMGGRRAKKRHKTHSGRGARETGTNQPKDSEKAEGDRLTQAPPANGPRRKWALAAGVCLLLLAGQIAVTARTSVPGYLVIDEVIYQWMTRDIASTGSVVLQTGYSETPSPELFHALHMSVRNGSVYAQYPQLFPLLATPLYEKLGLYALIGVNSLAFLGVVALCWAIAWTLFRDARLAAGACLVLVLGTFSWEYSQHAWPHSIATLFSTAALLLGLRGLQSSGRRAVMLALTAGVIAGLGMCIRLDVIFVVPCIVLPFLFASPSRFREAASVLVGTTPCLVALGAINSVKFGTWNPLSYGPVAVDSSQRVPVSFGLILAVGVTVAWLISRPWFRSRFADLRLVSGILVIGAVVAVAATPPLREELVEKTHTFSAFVVDLRLLPSETPMPAMQRSPRGAVMYIGAYKKALLQSTPYLVVLLLPFLRVIRFPGSSWRLAFLLQLPIVTALALTAFSFHGGLCLNMRYFLPIFPVTSILVAFVVQELAREVVSWPARGAVVFAVMAAAGVAFSVVWGSVDSDRVEQVILRGPLLLAVVTAAAVLVSAFSRGALRGWTAKATVALIAAGLAWSGIVAFGYDLPHHRQQRVNNLEIGKRVVEQVPPQSFFFTVPYIDPFMKLIEVPDVVIALPAQDGMRDLPHLVEHALSSGRRAFGVLRLADWQRATASSLNQYRLRPLWSFEERFDHGPTLHDIGPYLEGGNHSPAREFVLVELIRKTAAASWGM